MKPFYESWKMSKHNNIPCVKCHIEPGIYGTIKGKIQAASLLVKYLTNTYSSKPFANIKDKNCLLEGCHIKEKLGTTSSFMGKSYFDHAAHYKKDVQIDMTCTSCHSPLKGGNHISVNESHCYLCHLRDMNVLTADTPGVSYQCVLCHRNLPEVIELGSRNIEHSKFKERGIDCNSCHSELVKGDGKVGHSTCFNCHDFAERANTRKDIARVHKIHVTVHIECYLCHNDIIHRINKEDKTFSPDCRYCHLKKHSGIKMLYSGKGGLGANERPGPMFEAGVSCIGCHNEPISLYKIDFSGMSLGAIKERCVECHNDKRYGEILDNWKTFINKRLKEIKEKLKEVKRVFKNLEDLDGEKLRLIKDAQFNYFFVRQGIGVHNVGYALELLKVAEGYIDTVLGMEQYEYKVKDKGIFWFYDTEGLNPVKFTHKLHRERAEGCVDCHNKIFSMELGSSDEYNLLTMSNILRGKFCGVCHNGKNAFDVRSDCNLCHIEK